MKFYKYLSIFIGITSTLMHDLDNFRSKFLEIYDLMVDLFKMVSLMKIYHEYV